MLENKRVLPPDVLVEEYRALLKEDGVKALPLGITGSSMSPFLVGGRDTAYLSRLDRPVKRGDILFYQRRSGAYILHRVYKVEPAGFTMVGDAQMVLEPGIRPEQVIALMTAARRKGKTVGPGSFWWEFFAKIWIRLIPVRRILVRSYTGIRRLFRR